jgi:2-desacetyl-2-hydroxyethyl bacteriochlorophyllide A dehydrogenase
MQVARDVSLPSDYTAVEIAGVGERPRLVRRALGDVAPGQALVRVDACGVCGSDVFLQKGGFGPEKLPVVPGHEAAGTVVAVGDPADEQLLGRQVALYYIDAPQDSRWARDGHENIGPEVVRMGVDVDGAFADYVVRPVPTLIPISESMDPASLAVATDALATPYHALTAVARLRAGETLVVLGIGGIGSNAVQIGRHLGAHVVAVARSAPKLELAQQLGAHAVVSSSEGAQGVVRAAGGQVDVVLQCAGAAAMDRFAVEVAGYLARVVLVGSSLERFSIAATELIWRELALLGSRGFTRRDIDEVVSLVAEGALTTEHLTSCRRPLDEAAEALEDLRSGRVLRAVLEPQGAGGRLP